MPIENIGVAHYCIESGFLNPPAQSDVDDLRPAFHADLHPPRSSIASHPPVKIGWDIFISRRRGFPPLAEWPSPECLSMVLVWAAPAHKKISQTYDGLSLPSLGFIAYSSVASLKNPARFFDGSGYLNEIFKIAG